jgi:hypothetical protein
VNDQLVDLITAGMPEVPHAAMAKIVTSEIMPKTLAFCPALTVGEVDDPVRLGAVASAVALMYWGDQTMDRGDAAMPQAIELLGGTAQSTDPIVQARFKALCGIEQKIRHLARPEDAPYVLACFYDQVLKHEVYLHRLSKDYQAVADKPAFVAEHAVRIAEITTISAGFPSISSSLYAIYRQAQPDLPPLKAVYANSDMTQLLQVCNVVVRLWDELGDWQMDAGHDPSKGLFVINPFNEYNPAMLQRFCELADIRNASHSKALQKAVGEFHHDRQAHTATVLQVLSEHTRSYFANLKPDLVAEYGQYITLCKRVMEIGYVNRIGDIALAAPAS